MTTLLHGADAAARAESTAREVFEQGGIGAELEVAVIPAAMLSDGLSAVQALVQEGLVPSGKEVKRLVAEGGLRFNNEVVADPQMPIDARLIGEGLKVSIGRKKHRLLKVEG